MLPASSGLTLGENINVNGGSASYARAPIEFKHSPTATKD
jgi:hypothetical protein